MLRRAFAIFHFTLGAVVFLQSLSTTLHAAGLRDDQSTSLALAWFAGAEAVAALLFLVPATMRLGAVLLLVIFGVALAFHGLHGELQSTLLVYIAGVILVMAHGSAFGRAAIRPEAAA